MIGLAEEVVAGEIDSKRGTVSLDKVFKTLKAQAK